jgi:acyl carrier protein
MPETLAQLQDIFRDVFDNASLEIGRDSSAHNVEGWDSLIHINLVVAVEQAFGIKFMLGELQGLENVGDMADLIDKKLSARR